MMMIQKKPPSLLKPLILAPPLQCFKQADPIAGVSNHCLQHIVCE